MAKLVRLEAEGLAAYGNLILFACHDKLSNSATSIIAPSPFHVKKIFRSSYYPLPVVIEVHRWPRRKEFLEFTRSMALQFGHAPDERRD